MTPRSTFLCFKNRAFTLIELLIILVVLGVLAATAIPRFVSLGTNANEAALRAMGGSLLSSSNMVYTKSALLGVHRQATANVDLNADGSTDVAVEYGFPSAHRVNGIPRVMDGLTRNWSWSANAANTIFLITTASLGGGAGLKINNVPITTRNCYIQYFRATNTAPPRVAYITTGC